MIPSVKNTTFLILIIFGFLFFLFNANILSLNYKNISSPKQIKSIEQKVEINKNSHKSKVEKENVIKDFSYNDYKLQNKEIIITVKKGQTFLSILDDFNFDNKRKFEIINSINKIFDLRELKVNQKINFIINNEEKVKKIIIELSYNTNIEINLGPKIQIEKKQLETFTEINSKEYLITNSLYADGINNKIPNQILIKLIQLFSFDLDFQRDIQKNTKVSVSYEKINVKNKSESSFGDIEYAQIIIKNNTLEYFKFLTDDGFIDYFNREGKNVKKSILKTPLDGARLSSSFGMRKHPISGFNKMHKGIDFAAPKGTPIYAGGNGVIEMAGVNGGYGKYIRIRHNNEYKTAYAHLSSFKKGISKGVRVNQGEVIGYVGSTGRSTGPHLHYEIIYQNKQINPLTLKLPSGKILKGSELERFIKNYKMIYANHLNNLFE